MPSPLLSLTLSTFLRSCAGVNVAPDGAGCVVSIDLNERISL